MDRMEVEESILLLYTVYTSIDKRGFPVAPSFVKRLCICSVQIESSFH